MQSLHLVAAYLLVGSAFAADEDLPTTVDCDCGAVEDGQLDDDHVNHATHYEWLQYIIMVILITMSGLFSGLTLGLLGLDMNGLEIVMNGDDDEAAAAAASIAPIRAKGNQLLCSLLLGNVAVNALLSILMADLFGGLISFLMSTIFIVIFGEIGELIDRCSRRPSEPCIFYPTLTAIPLYGLALNQCSIQYHKRRAAATHLRSDRRRYHS